MTEQRIEDKLKSGFEKVTPNVLDSVLKDCADQGEQRGQIIVMDRRRSNRTLLRFAGIAAALVLLVGGFLGFRTWQVNNRVASIVSLDVNPSIEIRVSEKEKVLEVTPLNEDGRIIAGDMDFKGSSLEVAVNALVGSMLRNGYLSELANSILVSIENDDPTAASALEQKLMTMVSGLLGDAHLDGAVLGQVVSKDQAVEDLAKSCGISVGKARLIEVLTAAEPRYAAEELAGLSINELNNLYARHRQQSASKEDEESIDSIGKASTQAYIGEEAALQIALKDAGIGEGTVRTECGLDWENGRMVYEVEFEANGTEYEYDIDALTGEIVKVEKDTADRDEEHDDDRDDDDDDGWDDDDDGWDDDRDDWDDDDDRDDDGKNAAETTPDASAGTISKEEARQAALKKAGVSEDSIRNYRIESDVEKGKQVYEIEFNSDGREYEITVDAVTGEILEYDVEKDD